MAARTRAALSRTDVSGSPTISILGSWALIRTSTSTGWPSMPTRAALITWVTRTGSPSGPGEVEWGAADCQTGQTGSGCRECFQVFSWGGQDSQGGTLPSSF